MCENTLQALILESQNHDTKEAHKILYKFVSSALRPFEIEGFEKEGLALLINFSVKRENIKNPLSLDEAEEHLIHEDCKLIKRYTQIIDGWHTHNVKFPLSTRQGNIRKTLNYDNNDIYIHSGSVRLSKRYSYAKNGARNKASKCLLTEFLLHGTLTSLIEEIKKNNSLGKQFIAFLRNAYKSINIKEDSKDNPIDTLHQKILSTTKECFPSTATDLQIYAHDNSEILLSPFPSTGLMREINMRLSNCVSWQTEWIKVGTGQDIMTYGDFLSDCSGWLRTLKSKLPTERKGEFRELVNNLGTFGNLYNFKKLKQFLDKNNYSTIIINQDTGEQRARINYKHKKNMKENCEALIINIFNQYRRLDYYLAVGRTIPSWCNKIIQDNDAQQYLTKLKKNIRSKDRNLIADELIILLKEQVSTIDNIRSISTALEHAIRDACLVYLKSRS